MKNKKILAVGLCGAICLSLAGFTYALPRYGIASVSRPTDSILSNITENPHTMDSIYNATDIPLAALVLLHMLDM